MSPELTKFINVFYAGIGDSAGFMRFYVMMILYFLLIFHCLGADYDEQPDVEPYTPVRRLRRL